MNDDVGREYLEPGRFVDSAHPAVVAFARREAEGLADPREIAVRLYYAVRDGLRYDPYDIDTRPSGMTASACLARGVGFCVTKAATYAAALRVHGIASRLGFADVRNHMTSRRLREKMGTDLFAYHGYTEVRLDGRWIKATPAFNVELCTRAGTLPLEFDGTADSILHPFDAGGRRHMEYVRDHGTRADVPLDEMLAAWRVAYPTATDWLDPGGAARRPATDGRFEDEVERA
jgi:transglutaminase-like putative cysteine protease